MVNSINIVHPYCAYNPGAQGGLDRPISAAECARLVNANPDIVSILSVVCGQKVAAEMRDEDRDPEYLLRIGNSEAGPKGEPTTVKE